MGVGSPDLFGQPSLDGRSIIGPDRPIARNKDEMPSYRKQMLVFGVGFPLLVLFFVFVLSRMPFSAGNIFIALSFIFLGLFFGLSVLYGIEDHERVHWRSR